MKAIWKLEKINRYTRKKKQKNPTLDWNKMRSLKTSYIEKTLQNARPAEDRQNISASGDVSQTPEVLKTPEYTETYREIGLYLKKKKDAVGSSYLIICVV